MTNAANPEARAAQDGRAYRLVSFLLHGGDGNSFAALPLTYWAHWQTQIGQLLAAYAAGGQGELLRCYLRLVYEDAGFGSLMASLGLRRPEEPWPADEWPQHPLQHQLSFPANTPSLRANSPFGLTLRELATGAYRKMPVQRRARREEELLAALAVLPAATAAELMQFTGQERSNLYRRLRRLCAEGQVQRQETPNGTAVYRLPLQGSQSGEELTPALTPPEQALPLPPAPTLYTHLQQEPVQQEPAQLEPTPSPPQSTQPGTGSRDRSRQKERKRDKRKTQRSKSSRR